MAEDPGPSSRRRPAGARPARRRPAARGTSPATRRAAAASPTSRQRSGALRARTNRRASVRPTTEKREEQPPDPEDLEVTEHAGHEVALAQPDEQRVQRGRVEELGRLLQRRLVEHELVAVVEAGDLGQHDHQRQGDDRRGREAVVLSEDLDADAQRHRGGEDVGDGEAPPGPGAAPQHVRAVRGLVDDRRAERRRARGRLGGDEKPARMASSLCTSGNGRTRPSWTGSICLLPPNVKSWTWRMLGVLGSCGGETRTSRPTRTSDSGNVNRPSLNVSMRTSLDVCWTWRMLGARLLRR